MKHLFKRQQPAEQTATYPGFTPSPKQAAGLNAAHLSQQEREWVLGLADYTSASILDFIAPGRYDTLHEIKQISKKPSRAKLRLFKRAYYTQLLRLSSTIVRATRILNQCHKNQERISFGPLLAEVVPDPGQFSSPQKYEILRILYGLYSDNEEILHILDIYQGMERRLLVDLFGGQAHDYRERPHLSVYNGMLVLSLDHPDDFFSVIETLDPRTIAIMKRVEPKSKSIKCPWIYLILLNTTALNDKDEMAREHTLKHEYSHGLNWIIRDSYPQLEPDALMHIKDEMLAFYHEGYSQPQMEDILCGEDSPYSWLYTSFRESFPSYLRHQTERGSDHAFRCWIQQKVKLLYLLKRSKIPNLYHLLILTPIMQWDRLYRDADLLKAIVNK
ncbi:hypothetical protein [Magnetococcus sp. PR-3]|uniref:hypothetical protein n=1 Tax=Magnetococcus sp. PR-3 TaxID=3120355 RepID=UPI002FCE195E